MGGTLGACAGISRLHDSVSDEGGARFRDVATRDHREEEEEERAERG